MPSAPAVTLAQFLTSEAAQAFSAAQIEHVAAFHAEHGPATLERYLAVAETAPERLCLPPILTVELERELELENDLLRTTG